MVDILGISPGKVPKTGNYGATTARSSVNDDDRPESILIYNFSISKQCFDCDWVTDLISIPVTRTGQGKVAIKRLIGRQKAAGRTEPHGALFIIRIYAIV